jgi:hypothetical protein
MWVAYDIISKKDIFGIVFINIGWEDYEKYIEADINGDTDICDSLIKKGIENKDIHLYIDDGTKENKPDFNGLKSYLQDNVKMLFGYGNFRLQDVIFNWYIKSANMAKGDVDSMFKVDSRTEGFFRIHSTVESIGWYSARELLGVTYQQSRVIFSHIKTVDLSELHYLTRTGVSLLQTGINLKYHDVTDFPNSSYVLEDINLRTFTRLLVNRVLIICKLFYEGYNEFKLRLYIKDKYKLDVLSAPRSKVGDQIFINLYSQAIDQPPYTFMGKKTNRQIVHFNEIISDKIEFKTKELNDILNRITNKKIRVGYNDELDETVILSENKYAIKLGGLHGKDPPDIFASTDKLDIWDADADSYYPYLIINELVCPAHMDTGAFIAVVKSMTTERIEFKQAGLVYDADALKIALNNIFGKLGFEMGILYDLKALYTVTINGQLFILMFVEQLMLAGFKCISANTDGVVALVPRSRVEEYKAVCLKWAKQCNFNLSFTQYSKYIRSSVSDYIAVRMDGSLKEKGTLSTKLDLTKGYYAPIVKKAIINHLLYNISVDETLHSCTDIYDFCISQKVGDQFEIEAHSIEGSNLKITKLQKNIRYYVSTSGVALIKRYAIDTSTTGTSNKGKTVSLVQGQYCKIFNKFVPVTNMKDYGINYNFYKTKAYETIYVVNRVHNKQIRSGLSGNLFKGLDGF